MVDADRVDAVCTSDGRVGRADALAGRVGRPDALAGRGGTSASERNDVLPGGGAWPGGGTDDAPAILVDDGAGGGARLLGVGANGPPSRLGRVPVPAAALAGR